MNFNQLDSHLIINNIDNIYTGISLFKKTINAQIEPSFDSLISYIQEILEENNILNVIEKDNELSFYKELEYDPGIVYFLILGDHLYSKNFLKIFLSFLKKIPYLEIDPMEVTFMLESELEEEYNDNEINKEELLFVKKELELYKNLKKIYKDTSKKYYYENKEKYTPINKLEEKILEILIEYENTDFEILATLEENSYMSEDSLYYRELFGIFSDDDDEIFRNSLENINIRSDNSDEIIGPLDIIIVKNQKICKKFNIDQLELNKIHDFFKNINGTINEFNFQQNKNASY